MARDPLRKLRPPSDKQRAARDRNWRVWKLRGLWWNSFPMTGERRDAYRAAIDAELALLGAEPQAVAGGFSLLVDAAPSRAFRIVATDP
jgi:hypothetical protein